MLRKTVSSVTAEIAAVPQLPSNVQKSVFWKLAFDLFRKLQLFGLLCAPLCYKNINLKSIAQNQHLLAAKRSPVCCNCQRKKICPKRWGLLLWVQTHYANGIFFYPAGFLKIRIISLCKVTTTLNHIKHKKTSLFKLSQFYFPFHMLPIVPTTIYCIIQFSVG